MKKLTAKFPKLKILVVEDNFINQEVTRDILEFMGCQVDIAKDGLEAVKMAAETAYELILMDIQVPEIDGYEATGRIRQESSKLPRPIIVALTAGALEGDKDKCLKAGMDDYISKPMEASHLEEMLKKHFPLKMQPLHV